MQVATNNPIISQFLSDVVNGTINNASAGAGNVAGSYIVTIGNAINNVGHNANKSIVGVGQSVEDVICSYGNRTTAYGTTVMANPAAIGTGLAQAWGAVPSRKAIAGATSSVTGAVKKPFGAITGGGGGGGAPKAIEGAKPAGSRVPDGKVLRRAPAGETRTAIGTKKYASGDISGGRATAIGTKKYASGNLKEGKALPAPTSEASGERGKKKKGSERRKEVNRAGRVPIGTKKY